MPVSNLVYAEKYRWKNENGRLHFSDRLPKTEKQIAETLEIRRLLSEEQRFNKLSKEMGMLSLKMCFMANTNSVSLRAVWTD